jgi:CheY-like chemotaxis protein
MKSNKGSVFHDLRSSLNGVICMGSLLQDSELDEDQADILRYMMMSADKAMGQVRDLQLNYSHIPKEDSPASEKSAFAAEPIPRKKNKSGPLSILVAEDDEVSRLYLTTLLRRENWNIDEASDGREALDLFNQGDYNLILMDVSMPGVDGIQAARTIRETDAEVPILAITAHGEGELQEEFRQAGMSDVLRKPIHDEYLIGKIKSIYPES